MNKKVNLDDISVLLYMVPFIASGVYAIYLSVVDKVSYVLSSSTYLTVTRDPNLFLLGTFCVFLGAVIEISSTSFESRTGRIADVGRTLQNISLTSLILAIICVLYANKFTDFSGAANDFVSGKFSFVFPIVMLALSYLVTARFSVGEIKTPSILGIVALLLVPVSLYELGRKNTILGLVTTFILMTIGLGLLLLSRRSSGGGKTSGEKRQSDFRNQVT